MKKSLVFVSLLSLSGLSLSGFSSQALATELKLELNLPQQTGEYHNPYVAIWLEDSSGKSIRTLALWREGAKWLKDIRRWWRKVGRKDAELVDAITSATHAAGRYQLSFDAVDDNQQPLAAGDYILRIEVVRENGGRSMVKQPFTLTGKSQRFTLAATPETAQSTFIIKE
ncbi:DUF2271 domain-containing protein [Thalassotalea euphylliae]|uniref:DUF2271 domain-containing protein n=1 Tax=Thalassotalea euphylliae TaxID=1655234 RepID=A0A3E0TW42_9GAMM|nr:DUF2271 domain-containing protein [Thalassotalea euphylliae]REL28891.1 DUF2271 domain-containing protein [Thalassotalea euphylliae]